MPLGASTGKGRAVKTIQRGTYLMAQYQPLAAGAQILLQQPLQSLPRAVGTYSVLALMGQGTFCHWWV